MKKHNFLKIFLGVLFLTMLGIKGIYSQVQRQVNYCTVTRTYYAVPNCIDETLITDLDRVKMMSDDVLECTENAVDAKNCLTITTYYPQVPRYEYDYQYMVGKSVTSVNGVFLYDHNGEELMHQENTGFGENLTLLPEVIGTLGIYNQMFEVDKNEITLKLREEGFNVYEDEGFIVGVSDMVEISINLYERIFEIRFFADEDGCKKLKQLHRTNYIKTNSGYVVPIEETLVSYDMLPSEISYQITRVKSYLFYQVIQNGNDIINVGEKQPYEEYLDGLQKSVQNGENISQFEEIHKRNTELKVFPDPAKEQITVSLPFYMNENSDITLYNTFGVAVLSYHHTRGEQINIGIYSLPAGVYVVYCTKDGNRVSTIFIKE